MYDNGRITKKAKIDMTIKIVTKLNEGIADKFAGVQRVHHEFSTGPRNLLKAVETLITHRKKMENCHGNIGCGSSWIIIDGVSVDEHIINDYFFMLDFSNMTKAEYAQQFGHHVEKPTRTKWAEKTLSDFIKNNQSQKPIII